MVGQPKKTVTTNSLYNPHNYRLYFSFKKDNFKSIEGMVGVWYGKSINYGKDFTSTGEGIRVTVRKTQIEVINKLTEEQWFLINRAKAKEEIYSICNKIDEKCIASLKRFIEIYGGQTDFIILKREARGIYNNLNTKSDNKVMQEPFIDSLPLDMTFETPIVKKVYKKPNVEFKEPIYAARYLENSALNEFSPEICQELEKINLQIQNMQITVEKKDGQTEISIEEPPIQEPRQIMDFQFLIDKIQTIEDIRGHQEIIDAINQLPIDDNFKLMELKKNIFGVSR